MVEIFGREIAFLEELANDLADSFRVIAYVEANNTTFIRERQREIKKQYERFLDDVVSDAGQLRIIPAYDALMGLLEGKHMPETIKEDCENALAFYLFDPDELSEDYPRAFEGFFPDD